MGYVLDGLLVLLFVICIVLGWRRGLIKTASGLIALAAAVLVSALLSATVAQAVYTKAVEPAVISALEGQIKDNTIPAAEQVDTALEQMPALATALLRAQGLDSGEAVLARLNVEEAGASLAQGITRQVITPVVLPVFDGLCAVLLFVVTYLAAILLLHLLNVVARLPLLKGLNKVLGLAAGVLSGALWVMFAVGLLTTLAYLCWIPALTPEVLEKTVLISWLRTLMSSLV